MKWRVFNDVRSSNMPDGREERLLSSRLRENKVRVKMEE